MSQILQNKAMVLYIQRGDENSNMARNMAEAMSDIHIQDVEMLPAESIPQWLNSTPTCVMLKTKKVYRGGKALQYLNQRYESIKQMVMQQQQKQQSQQQFAQQPPQQQFAQQPPRGNMGPGMGRPPAQRTQGPPPGARGAQMQGTQVGQRSLDIPSKQAQMAQNVPGEVEAVQSSLQPASGTGQFGCSLDAAFQTSESEVDDPRYKTSTGGISETERQAYMQMRASTGQMQRR
jgi:hypothetical protein